LTIRIVIADDHHVVRTGFASLLDTQPDFTVVGTAPDGASAVRLCQEVRPDLVLMDVRMPVMDGIEATRALNGGGEAGAGPRVLILTTFGDRRPSRRDGGNLQDPRQPPPGQAFPP